MLKHQAKLIWKKDWDVLVVLDACRYDYFKALYSKYLEGKLSKVCSPASYTVGWCKTIFRSNAFEDVVYISANPYINSKVPVNGFDARNKFHKIMDVWDCGWDPELGTVPPQAVSHQLEEKVLTSDKKLIAHYMQPHAPYLGLDLNFSKSRFPFSKNKNLAFKRAFQRFLSFIEFKITPPLPMLRIIYWLRILLGMEKEKDGDPRIIFAKRGLKELRKAYMKNLELVLSSLSRLFQQGCFEGKKVIITADHGELLGNRGFSHPKERKTSELIEVPWLVVDN